MKKLKRAIDFETDTKPEPTEGELTRISKLVQYQLTMEDAVTSAEDDLARLRAKLRQVQEVDLPEAMRECGFDKMPITVLGKTIEVKSDLTMSIPKDPEKYKAALDWLRKNDLGDLIEQDVSLSFGRGEEEKAQLIIKGLLAKGLHPTSQILVNTARVKAAVRERLAQGKDVPLEKLGAYRWTKSIIS